MNKYIENVDYPPIVELNNRIAEQEKQGPVVRLTQAVVDVFPQIHKFLHEQIDSDISTHLYTPDSGNVAIKNKLVVFFRSQWDYKGSQHNIFLTAGANNAFFSLMTVLLGRGDSVSINEPYYFNHRMTSEMMGGDVVTVPRNIDDIVKNMEKTSMTIIVSPDNPSGHAFNAHECEYLIKEAKKREHYIIFDETYALLQYNDNFSVMSLAHQYDNLIVIGSFSKCVPMAGWRLGYIHLPLALIDDFYKVQDCNIICAPTISQIMLESVLDSLTDNSKRINDILIERRDALLSSMRGYVDFIPQSACFLWVRVNDDMVFTERLLKQYSIGVMTGTYFGAKDYVRISYGSASCQILRKASSSIAHCIREMSS